MRRIATIDDEVRAKRFSAYLTVQGVRNQLEEADGDWAVWVWDDNDLDRARQELEAFEADPEAPRYDDVEEAARKELAGRQRAEDRYAKRQVNLRRRWQRTGRRRFGPLTLALVAIAVAAYVGMQLPSGQGLGPLLSINSYEVSGQHVSWIPGLPDIRSGQVWRLVTPIFIHFNLLHILFNLWWLSDLGNLIETRQGTWVLALLVLGTAVPSNLLQYAFDGPVFGGLSGVVFGLLGYVWMQSTFNPFTELYLPKRAVVIMLIWFAVGWVVPMLNIANWAHTGGLVVGVAAGYVASGHWWRRLRKMRFEHAKEPNE